MDNIINFVNDLIENWYVTLPVGTGAVLGFKYFVWGVAKQMLKIGFNLTCFTIDKFMGWKSGTFVSKLPKAFNTAEKMYKKIDLIFEHQAVMAMLQIESDAVPPEPTDKIKAMMAKYEDLAEDELTKQIVEFREYLANKETVDADREA